VLERLAENWLDSATERSFQVPFCQMLIGIGHRIVHSTRHGPIELGKDVITLDPSGDPCAFQLKSHPGRRLTLKQFNDILNQIYLLCNTAITHPDIPDKPHKSYLVTNGEIEEETQVAIRELNRSFEISGHPQKKLHVISRGNLLGWANDLGISLWPTELEDLNQLLELLVETGDGPLPIKKYHSLMCRVLRLGTSDSGFRNEQEIRRHITSAALLTAISIKNFYLKKNHFAIISTWVTFSSYIIATCEKHGFTFDRNAKPSLDIALDATYAALTDLCRELTDRKNLVEGYVLAEPWVYKWRYTLSVALMSLYWLWSQEVGWQPRELKDCVEGFIPETLNKFFWLWGEAVIPQFLSYLWYLRESTATQYPDHLLAFLLKSVIDCNKEEGPVNLMDPYYSIEDRIRHDIAPSVREISDPIRGENFNGRSFFTEPLFRLLVRTGLKKACKDLWPDYSKIGSLRFQPGNKWEYCLYRSDSGTEIHKQHPLEKHWSELAEESRDARGEEAPLPLKERKFLLMLFVMLYPYRATPSIVGYLGRTFNKCWFIDPAFE